MGAYNFENILASICIGSYFKIEPEKIKLAVENYHPSNNRSQTIKKNTNIIALDAYNANPSSMKEALSNFTKIMSEKRVVIRGDMLELGTETDSEHIALINQLKNIKLEQLILVGEYFGKFSQNIDCKHFISVEEAGKWLANKSYSDTYFLIKGSRKIKLENLVENIN